MHCVNPTLFLYITILVSSLAIQTEEHGKGDNFTPKTENRQINQTVEHIRKITTLLYMQAQRAVSCA